MQIGADERNEALAANVVPSLVALAQRNESEIAQQAIAACHNILIRLDEDETAEQLVDVNAVLPIVTCATAMLKAVTDIDRLNLWLNVRCGKYFFALLNFWHHRQVCYCIFEKIFYEESVHSALMCLGDAVWELSARIVDVATIDNITRFAQRVWGRLNYFQSV